MPPLEENFFRQWWWVTLGAPLWWVLGFNFFVYQLTALVLFLQLIYVVGRGGRRIFLPTSFFLLLLIVLVYGFSLGIHGLARPISRFLASSYNLSFWVMGLMLIGVMANVFSVSNVRSLLKVFYGLAWVIGVLAMVLLGLWIQGWSALTFPSPLYDLTQILGHTPLIEDSFLVRVLLWDWFASASRLRFNFFSPYATAAGGVILIVLTMLLTLALEEKRKKPFFIFLFVTNLFALLMTLSRISVLALIFSWAFVFLCQKKRVGLWIFLFFVILILTMPWIEKSMDFLMGLREGSAKLRWELYVYSLKQLHGIDWLFGLGIKPRTEAFVPPLGSHSTYLSLLFRTGMIGTLFFFLFQTSLLWRWYQLRSVVRDTGHFFFWRGLGWVFVGMAIWMITEDIDAPQLLAFLYFSFVGIFEGFRREILAIR